MNKILILVYAIEYLSVLPEKKQHSDNSLFIRVS